MSKLNLPSLGILLLLSGCTASHWDPTLGVGGRTGHIQGSALRPADEKAPSSVTTPATGKQKEAPQSVRFPGTGVFVKQTTPSVTHPSPQGDITLNFENTDIREVVKVIMSDLLGLNYILDPAVQGTATMETSRPLSRELLLPTLETLLRMNRAALVHKDGAYYVVPIATASRGTVTPQLGQSRRPLPKGYNVRIVPLKYIGAMEMNTILKPLAPEGSIFRVDPVRNLLVLAGSSLELGSLLDTIEMFDVNWIKGLSVGLFKIQHGNLQEIVKQVESLTSGEEQNPLAGMFRIVPIESANSLLVVTHQQEYLDQIATWIERLDQVGAENGDEAILYVYRVKHGEAGNLAQILGQIFAEGGQPQGSKAARVAPGLQAATIRSRRIASRTKRNSTSGATSRLANQSRSTGGGLGSTASTSTVGSTTASATTSNNTASTPQATGYRLQSGVNIVADEINNSLLIRATPAQYRQIANALAKLDILPLQVLVEATIVEVTLTGNLQYGLQWFFQARKDGSSSNFQLDNDTTGALSSGNFSGLFPGFNWSLVNSAGEIRALLSAFAEDSLVKVLSSPSVMVLDNHTARIQVGSEVPTLSSQSTSLTSADVVTNSVEYRETGVLLSVTPRVTPGGLVVMEVEQEVSDVLTTNSGVNNSPTISTRNIVSTVAGKDGQVVVLGGLIKDQNQGSQGGIPGLYKAPVVGWLFGQTTKKAERTELVVILTPRVLRDDQDLSRVTDEFRAKLQGLKERF